MIGEKIKQRREELEMSQMQLAIKTGYTSRSSINKIELGVNDVPRKKLSLFADALKVNIDYLLELDIASDKINSTLTKRLKELREELGYTQKEIADLTFTDKSQVSKWEHGIINPSIETLITLADLFNVSIDYLLGRDNDANTIVNTQNALSEREQALITIYKNIPPVSQSKLLAYAEGLQAAENSKHRIF